MDYIYNYAFLWISLITRTERSFFFFYCYEKKKRKVTCPFDRSIVRDEPESRGREGGGKRKRKEKSSISFFRTNKSIVDTILFQSAIKFAMSSL